VQGAPKCLPKAIWLEAGKQVRGERRIVTICSSMSQLFLMVRLPSGSGHYFKSAKVLGSRSKSAITLGWMD